MPYPNYEGFTLTDYIRDDDNKIVYPFDYWYDCVKVYLLKHLHGYTNKKIAGSYTFIASFSGADRSRGQVVANMLAESDLLIEAARKHKFPPKVLSGTMQPRIKGGVIN